jgi:hypothetical protein
VLELDHRTLDREVAQIFRTVQASLVKSETAKGSQLPPL